MPTLAQYRSYLQLPQVRAALDTIAWAEGGKSYNTLFGGGKFSSYATHPGNPALGDARFYNAQWNTTAAGRYQIVWSTYRTLAPSLGISDFSPESQDVLALAEAQAKGGLSNIVAGNFEQALKDLGANGRCAWAALPYSSCGQGRRPLQQTLNYYRSALAVYGGNSNNSGNGGGGNSGGGGNTVPIVNDNTEESDNTLLYATGAILLLILFA